MALTLKIRSLTLSIINRCRHRDLRRLELFAPHLGALLAAARHSGILLPLPSHRHDGGLLSMLGPTLEGGSARNEVNARGGAMTR